MPIDMFARIAMNLPVDKLFDYRVPEHLEGTLEPGKRVYVPFPNAVEMDFHRAISKARFSNADVLVLVLFGKDMAKGVTAAVNMGLKEKMDIVVPNLTLGMAETAGPAVMEGVVGALPWSWNVPFAYDYERGKKFVRDFAGRYNAYPSTSAASAYTILYEYKNAVDRARTFDTGSVIAALEGHQYRSLKDSQIWRGFDHQSTQTVYAVKCKPQEEVLKDKFKQDYFEIIGVMSGDEAARSKEEWMAARRKAGKSVKLE